MPAVSVSLLARMAPAIMYRQLLKHIAKGPLVTKNPDPHYWGNPPQTPSRTNSSHSSNPADQASYQPSSPQYTEAHPSPAPQKKRGCLIAVIIAAIVVVLVGIGGCVACTIVVSNVANHTADSHFGTPDLSIVPHDETPSDATAASNNEFLRNYYGLSASSDSISNDELSHIQDYFYDDNDKHPDDDGSYEAGVYYVGTEIPAGSYWFEGDDDDLSYFYILEPSTSNGTTTYNVIHINNYYGHNLMDLQEGEVLILDNNDEDMIPLDSLDETFSAPYESGTYRVGVDVPAGTYQLSLDDANDYSACYVMQDLTFTEDSYLYEAYYIQGDQPDEITLEEGTYIELYNMTMNPIVT